MLYLFEGNKDDAGDFFEFILMHSFRQNIMANTKTDKLMSEKDKGGYSSFHDLPPLVLKSTDRVWVYLV